MIAGQLLSVAVLFTLTKDINFYFSFGAMSIIQLVGAAVVFFGVKEPDIMDSKAGRHQEKKSFCGRLKSILKQTCIACYEDPPMFIGLLGTMFSRN